MLHLRRLLFLRDEDRGGAETLPASRSRALVSAHPCRDFSDRDSADKAIAWDRRSMVLSGRGGRPGPRTTRSQVAAWLPFTPRPQAGVH